MSVKKYRWLFVAICLLGCMAPLASAEEAAKEQPKKIRILGVGNSFTRNSVKYLSKIFASDPQSNYEVAYAYIGGCPLDRHVKMSKLAEAEPAVPKAKSYDYYIDNKAQGKRTLKQMLTDGKWDYVTIQQVSTKSWKPETYFPDSQILFDYIRKYQPDAEIVMHETWAYEKTSSRLREWKMDQQTMHDKLHAAYSGAAEKLGIRMIPVGTSFQNARKLPMWTVKIPEDFNPKTAKKGDPLPGKENSLNVGYSWGKNKKGEPKLNCDPHHAGLYGEYLGGLVWYQFFTGKDARTVKYVPRGISKEKADSLKEVAYQTVSELDKEAKK